MYHRKLPREYCCTVDYALSVFGGKWKPRLLCILGHATSLRYGELKKQMENISDAALATTLKQLEKAGIVQRHQYNEMPIRVEYSLTDKGRTLIPVLNTISDWAVDHSTPEMYHGVHFDKVHRPHFGKEEMRNSPDASHTATFRHFEES